jgi:hypothetical protein
MVKMAKPEMANSATSAMNAGAMVESSRYRFIY